MVVVPESTHSHNILFKFLFLSLYPHQERKPKGNKGALQEEDHWISSALKDIVMANTDTLPFTIYSMIISMGYCL